MQLDGLKLRHRIFYISVTLIILFGSAGLTYYNYSNGFPVIASAFPGFFALIVLPLLFVKNIKKQ